MAFVAGLLLLGIIALIAIRSVLTAQVQNGRRSTPDPSPRASSGDIHVYSDGCSMHFWPEAEHGWHCATCTCPCEPDVRTTDSLTGRKFDRVVVQHKSLAGGSAMSFFV